MKPSHELPKGHTVHVPHAKEADANANTGYIEKPYEYQEYPKWVDGRIVNNAEEEKALKAKE